MGKKIFTLAAPSFVIPGPIFENAVLLKDYVGEVGLTFFDSRACLGYTEKDLPVSLTGLGLKYHVHLPLDLDWGLGAEHVFRVVQALVQKSWFLQPDKFVLHPPPGAGLLEEFAVLWKSSGLQPSHLLLENIKDSDFSGLWRIIEDHALGICLDIGHIMAYDQMNILEKDIVWERTSLVHVYGREDHTGHSGLKVISAQGIRLLHRILSRTGDNTTVLLEVFSLQDFLDSRDILFQMADSWGMDFV